MFELTVEVQFSAAHSIRGHAGPCAQLHGHNYRAVFAIQSDVLNDQGMVMDFAELKGICRREIGPLDHAFLNDLPGFAEVNPTAEALAQHLFRAVAVQLPAAGRAAIRLARVTVYESDHSHATYWE